MQILSVKDLTEQGISISEVQQSLTLTYFNKKFHRRCDIPKKFVEKALTICTEISEMGKDSFITETNFSYTVWEEEKLITEQINVTNSNPQSEINTNSQKQGKIENSFSSSPYSQASYVAKDKVSTRKNESQLQMQVYIREEKNSDNFSDLSELAENAQNQGNDIVASKAIGESANVHKYRGAIVDKNNGQHIEESLLPEEISEATKESANVYKYRGAIVDKKKPLSSDNQSNRRSYRGIQY